MYKLFWEILLSLKITFVSQKGEPALQPFSNAHMKGKGRMRRELGNKTAVGEQ